MPTYRRVDRRLRWAPFLAATRPPRKPSGSKTHGWVNRWQSRPAPSPIAIALSWLAGVRWRRSDVSDGRRAPLAARATGLLLAVNS